MKPDETNSTRRFAYISALNAKKFGVPVGYLWIDPPRDNNCTFTHQSNNGDSYQDSMYSNSPLWLNLDSVFKLTGGCVIYTKLNDRDFSPEQLKAYLESGSDFTVTYYEVGKKVSTTRPRRDIINIRKATKNNYNGTHLLEDAPVISSFGGMAYRYSTKAYEVIANTQEIRDGTKNTFPIFDIPLLP